MHRPSLSDIENAFQPAREIDDAKKFAGRKEAVSEAYFSLLADGANIAVVGNRGIGKTSFARQIDNIARGDNTLLHRLNLSHDKKFDFLTVYLACGNIVTNTADLLERLLTTSNCLGDWIYDIPGAKREIEAYSPELGAKIFGVGANLSGTKTTESNYTPAISAHSIDTVFTNVCHAIIKEGVTSDGVLIIIDEFDQVSDPTGMAGLLKSLATNVPKLKFCIVGVAQDIHNLMKDHQSADRLFAGSILNLPPMSVPELTDIVRIAETSIEDRIKFSKEATSHLVKLAQGHPYMVHLVGKYALRNAFQNKNKIIKYNDITNALRSIAERGADPILESRYKKAVASSPQREIVFRALAQVRQQDGECWTSDAYKIALDKGVDNSSQYVGQLVIEDYGAEIEKVRERYYRFKDSLFATYVLARPPQFEENIG
ncbi:MAG TPA: hypothetical protein ENK84_00005 [Desulfobulbus sp.]|nr:hypothetical protein [Desulfobulbus sp.]